MKNIVVPDIPKVPFSLSVWHKLQFCGEESNNSAPATGSPPDELLELEEELLEDELELLEEELLTSPEEEDELPTTPEEELLEPTTIPEELELDDGAPLLELEEELVTPLELEEDAMSPLDELLELEELLLELESGFGKPDEELAPPGGVGFDPPLLHPCKARAPTVNSSSARFFKVSLLYVLILMT